MHGITTLYIKRWFSTYKKWSFDVTKVEIHCYDNHEFLSSGHWFWKGAKFVKFRDLNTTTKINLCSGIFVCPMIRYLIFFSVGGWLSLRYLLWFKDLSRLRFASSLMLLTFRFCRCLYCCTCHKSFTFVFLHFVLVLSPWKCEQGVLCSCEGVWKTSIVLDRVWVTAPWHGLQSRSEAQIQDDWVSYD